jgi:uncharacterized protein YraI
MPFSRTPTLLAAVTLVMLALAPAPAFAVSAITLSATKLYNAPNDPSVIIETVPAGIAVNVTQCPANSNRCFIEKAGTDGFVDKTTIKSLKLDKPLGLCLPGKKC